MKTPAFDSDINLIFHVFIALCSILKQYIISKKLNSITKNKTIFFIKTFHLKSIRKKKLIFAIRAALHNFSHNFARCSLNEWSVCMTDLSKSIRKQFLCRPSAAHCGLWNKSKCHLQYLNNEQSTSPQSQLPSGSSCRTCSGARCWHHDIVILI